MSPSPVSVIIPCYNAERQIRACLDGLGRQDYGDFEIVVVDDGSADSTLSVLKEYAGIKVVECAENRGPAFARNRGIEASGGDLLVFLDSDCVTDDPEWLSRHVRVQSGLFHTIVGGGIQGIGEGIVARADRYSHWLTNIPYSRRRVRSLSTPRRRVRFSQHLVSTNLSIKRSTLLRIGLFDESLRTGEDVELCERALRLGVTLRFEPDIVVKHHDRESLGEFFRCFYRAGIDRVPARRRHQSQYHYLMPRGILSSLLLLLPIGLLAPLQPMRAWWPYEKRVVLYYPLIAIASFAMALGILHYWRTQRNAQT